ncbi:hypothetical protein [Moorella sp. E306M]|uniref:hypothetical protein n=1 Tax=Moorella sp. E306M TaxID=2572683 RepID=UPI0010FFB217|nr:hypothetical protein [Moorella sp. E306M]GEA17774.1 hypothetical protein E306M_09080 [Moorella sp. E306M]GEA17843.1 hypothetical protein E306M_09770 [Moorella sp. E306M]
MTQTEAIQHLNNRLDKFKLPHGNVLPGFYMWSRRDVAAVSTVLDELAKLQYQVAEVRGFLKKELRFIPDCGGDYCCLVDDTQNEPEDWPAGDCPHKGYCKTFIEIERKRDKLLARLEGA